MTEPSAPEPRPWPLGLPATVFVLVVVAAVSVATTWLLTRDRPRSLGAVEVGFLDDMSLHHQGAVNLSFAYLETRGDGPMAHYAREIVVDQSQEISLMNGLLASADLEDDRGGDDGTVMGWMGAPVPVAEMPGMATAADYARLRASSGVRADDVFSELMIGHHVAGIAMADHAVAKAADGATRRLAEAMSRVQRQEVDQMNRRRVSLGLAAVPVDLSAPVHQHAS